MASQKAAGPGRVGRPSRDTQNATAERIISAAMALFASRGFAGTSMEQVAADCGAGKDTVYRRFPSKVALFEAVVDHAHKRAIARLQDLPEASGDALERLRLLMLELLRINMEPELIALKRITFSEAVVFEKQGPIPQQPDPITERLVAAVSAAQAGGMMAGGNAGPIANHLIHCMVALPSSSAMLGSREFASAKAVDEHFERTWTWLVNGLRPA